MALKLPTQSLIADHTSRTNPISKAFILGAGLGTRLRPLTDDRPKPLVPIFNKPLVTYALDHLASVGIHAYALNTHHCAQAYKEQFRVKNGDAHAHYHHCTINFYHEPTLLGTGGGIKNIEHWIKNEPFIVYNGDVLTDLPIEQAIKQHLQNNAAATLVLRSSGGPLQVQFDPDTGWIKDINRTLGSSNAPSYLFTGLYILSAHVFKYLDAGVFSSIIPAFIKMIKSGETVQGIVINDGHWSDLANVTAYWQAHRMLAAQEFRLAYPFLTLPHAIHPTAYVPDSCAQIDLVAIGAHCHIAPHSRLEESILWNNVRLSSGTHLVGSIIRNDQHLSGEYKNIIV